MPADPRRVAHSFSVAAKHYDHYAVLQREIGQRLLERLDYIKHQPQLVVDAGCGTGFCSRLIARRFKKARVLGFDLAPAMLAQARAKKGWFSKQCFEQGDMSSLPLEDNSVDFIFSNLALQWVDDLDGCFREWQRLLKPRGLLLFSTFGPDTLQELRSAWRSADQHDHVNRFADMHDLGDGLVRARFAEPVMDVEMLTTTYSSVGQLMRELKGIGAHYVAPDRRQSLTGKNRLAAMVKAYQQHYQQHGLIPATWEVVYGHAWGSDAVSPSMLDSETYLLNADLSDPRL